jgi:excisionase family DNA binding protein
MKLTPQQAAKKTGVSVSLIYLWCSEKRLLHYRLGAKGKRGRILIEEMELEKLVETQKVAINPKPTPNSSLKHIQIH